MWFGKEANESVEYFSQFVNMYYFKIGEEMFQIVRLATVFYQLVADIVWLNGRANSVCCDHFIQGG